MPAPRRRNPSASGGPSRGSQGGGASGKGSSKRRAGSGGQGRGSKAGSRGSRSSGGYQGDRSKGDQSKTRRSDSSGRGRDKTGGKGASSQRRRRDLKGAAVDLPNWVIEDLSRTTPNHRIADALEELGEATAAFGEGRYQKSLRHALKAKDLAPRDASVREVLALSAYRTGDWKQALRELRTYRRLSGELTHVPVEMDVLRALGRGEEVPKVWQLLKDHETRPAVLKEGRVVYASHLIDEDQLAAAREVVKPGRMSVRPFDEDLRVWYVAARAAALDGDGGEARRLRNAILEHDAAFPGIDELEKLISRLD